MKSTRKDKKRVHEEADGLALSIPVFAKSIPIVYEERFSDCLGGIVKFKAQVMEIPGDLASSLFLGLGIYAEEVFEYAYKPLMSKQTTLCLKVTGDNTEIKKHNKISIPIKGALFAQTHLEEFDTSPELEKILDSAIPERNRGITGVTYTGYEENKYYVTQGNVRTTFRKPNVLNYYIETDLNNPHRFGSDINILRQYVRRADRNIQEAFHSEGKKRYKSKLDFLFDYQRAPMFDSRGILESKEVSTIMQTNPHFAIVKSWLQGDLP